MPVEVASGFNASGVGIGATGGLLGSASMAGFWSSLELCHTGVGRPACDGEISHVSGIVDGRGVGGESWELLADSAGASESSRFVVQGTGGTVRDERGRASLICTACVIGMMFARVQ